MVGLGISGGGLHIVNRQFVADTFQNVAGNVASIPKVAETPVRQNLTESAKRDRLVAAAPDLIKSALETPKGTAGISGDVVWSNSLQKGYVTFRGLPANDPGKETYQLWIVDENQDPKNPG